ncbi:MAG: dynamin family protein [Anaerolineales bacterium]
MQLLTQTQQEILQEERQALLRLQGVLARLEAAAEDREALESALLQLDDFFLIVVAGEFNAGKSALINALLGADALEEGVTPTTTQVTILRHGEREERRVLNAWQQAIEAPLEVLRELSIVDTPGTNAIVREHEAITRRFLPRADLVLFVTSADRPFTESERNFLTGIRDWGKKIVFVINKIDLITDETDRAKILGFVRENAQALLGMDPKIFAVSARRAKEAKRAAAANPDTTFSLGDFLALERYIRETLDARERLRLKFASPLGVGENLLRRYQEQVRQTYATLQEDLKALAHVENQLTLYRQDMEAGFARYMADIENSLYQMALRGNEYFAETLRLGRIFDLLDRKRIQQEFSQKVVANTPQEIQDKVQALIDWLLNNDLKQWQAVHEYLHERRQTHAGQLVGVNAAFRYDRQRLLDGLEARARQVLETYDKAHEAEQLAESVQTAVAATAAAEIGAIGLGAVITAVATTAAADVSGLLLAGSVAVLGLFVIPARRRKAEKELREKLESLRRDLSVSLRGAFGRELEAGLTRIADSIAPYARFVRGQHEKLEGELRELETLAEEIARLQARVQSEI